VNHVAFLIPTIDRMGGAERQVLLLAQGMAERGWRVTVIALAGTGGVQACRLKMRGVDFVSLRMRKGLVDPRGWLGLNSWLRREKPDVLHAHLPHAAWMARWSRLFVRVPVVVDTIHTAGTGTRGRKLGYRMSNWLTDKVTAVSGGAADAWRNARMIPKHKLVVLPNGVDTEHWKPSFAGRAEMRDRLGMRDGFLWLAAGRLEAVKDFPTLLRAFAGLPSDARLLIAGEGSQRAELESLVSLLDVAGRVHLLGYSEDILPWMQAADGFVLSSLWEGLPMSLLEAGACALPAVSTDVAGATEILPSTGGFLADVGDSQSLRAAMLRLMELPEAAREEMGMRTRLQVEERYSLAAVLERWEALYTELLERRTPELKLPRIGNDADGIATHEAAGTSACAHDADAGAT
jgi:glycosyltransferase involved in cell wall biosynthesis